MGLLNEIKVYFTGDSSKLVSEAKQADKALEGVGTSSQKSTKHLEGLIQSLPGVGGLFSGMSGKMKETSGVSEELGGAASGMGLKVAAGAAVAGVAIAELAFKGAEKFGQLGLEVEKFSQVSGQAPEAASRWVAVATDFGVGADTLSGGIGKLGKALGNNADALGKYGVEAVKAKDGSVDLTATTFKVIDAYNQQTDATKKDALAAAAFGKGYQALIPLLDVGSTTIKAAFDKVHGAEIFDEKKIEAAKEFRLKMDELHKSFMDIELTVGEKLIPVITELASGLISIAGPVSTGVSKAFNGLVYGIQGIATVLTAGVWGDFTEKSRQAGEAVGTTSALVDDATATLLLHNRALRDPASAESYQQNQKQMAEANAAFTKSIQAEQSAFEAMQGALDASTAKALDSQSADLKAAAAVDTYTASLKDSKLSVNDHKQAFIDVQQSINGAADTYANYVVNQIKGTGQILTADDEARIRHQAQIDKLGELQQTVAPGSALWNAIQQYIDHLKSIPTSIATSISAKGIPNTGGTGGTSKVGMAKGGRPPVGRATLVGEDGPEMFVPDEAGTIIPNGHVKQSAMTPFDAGGASDTTLDQIIRQMNLTPEGRAILSGDDGQRTDIPGQLAGSRAATAPTVTNHYSITVNVPPGVDVGRSIVEQIRQYERANGSRWREA